MTRTRALDTIVALLALSLAVGCPAPSDDDDDQAFEDDDDWDDDDDDDGWDDDDYSDDDDDTWGDDDDTGDDDDDGDGDDDDDTTEEPDDVCDDAPVDPTTLYLSADDSNSQAAPVLARQMIQEGTAITSGMRPYEFLNYYSFYFPPAQLGHVRLVPQMRDDGDGNYTLLIGISAPSIADVGRRPRSLTFSVDSSGSMNGHPMEMIQEVLRNIAHNLVEGDVVSLMSWNSYVATELSQEAVDGPDDADLLAAIEGLAAGGSTDLESGLEAAYAEAVAMYGEDRLNRVILLSDGGANVGVTEETLIGEHADDAEAEGIFLVGVGMDEIGGAYDDALMDAVTDAGKGAYVYIDSADEAARMFGDDDRFATLVEIAARDVQLAMTMPEGYVMAEFHGEEYSPDPDEVEPQHLAPGDAMLFHQQLLDCASDLHDGEEAFTFTASWTDPVTREARVDELTMTVDEMIDAAGLPLIKADAVVAYALALRRVWSLPHAEREAYLESVIAQVNDAYFDTGDADLAEIVGLLQQYRDDL